MDGYLGCFHVLAIINNAAVYIHVQAFVWTYVFHFPGYIPTSGIVGSYGNSMFNFLSNCQSVFHRGCTILYSHQYWESKTGNFPYPHRHLFSGFLNSGILLRF